MLELRKLQLCQLDIALDIKKICEKHSIDYFMIGGTLLGAVRHQGFIPWDDDLDIGMLRKDYERFLVVCKSELPAHLFLQTWDTDEEYGYSFAKVMLKGTVFREVAKGLSKSKSMIFVDIFPYDNMPENMIVQKVMFLTEDIAKKILLTKLGYEIRKQSKHAIYHTILAVMAKLFSVNFLKRVIISSQMFANKSQTKRVINFSGAYRDREWLDSRLVVTEDMQFEGYTLKAPQGWRQLLTNMYGDYMQLPPVEKRGNRHLAMDIDIGEYKIRCKCEDEK